MNPKSKDEIERKKNQLEKLKEKFLLNLQSGS